MELSVLAIFKAIFIPTLKMIFKVIFKVSDMIKQVVWVKFIFNG
jgi:hypothetical protein